MLERKNLVGITLTPGSTIIVQTDEAAINNLLNSSSPRDTALGHLAYVFGTQVVDGLEADAQASMSPDELKAYHEQEARFNEWAGHAIDLTVI